MIGWLKRRLRKWLLEDEKTDDVFLECRIPKKEYGTKLVTYQITNSQGIRLLGENDGEIRLVGENDTIDRDKFWRIWRKFNPHNDLRWEDGEVFDPAG